MTAISSSNGDPRLLGFLGDGEHLGEWVAAHRRVRLVSWRKDGLWDRVGASVVCSVSRERKGAVL